MVDPAELTEKADALSALLRAKLGVRGATLAVRLRRAGRLLPKRLRGEGQRIVTAQNRAAHPKLARTVDPALLNTAFAELTAHLKEINPAERRTTRLLHWLAGAVFNLLVIVVAVGLLLRWQGWI